MKIIKIAQNIQYLTSIGVPQENAQAILDYLKQLEGDNRKIAINVLRKNPNASFEELNSSVAGANKMAYMQKMGIDPKIAEWAIGIDEKNSVWIAKEAQKWVKMILDSDPSDTTIDPLTKGTKSWTKYSYEQAKTLGNGMNYLLSCIVAHVEYTLDWARVENPNLSSMSLLDANETSKEWHQSLANKEVDESIEYSSHQTVFKFEDGWEIVKLESGDCSAEGELMGHCVGGYSKDVSDGSTQIYSLRDPKNKPHVTLEMTIPDDPAFSIDIEQIQGKGNDEPIPEYKERIKQWFQYLQEEGREFNPMESGEYGGIAGSSVEDIEEIMKVHSDYGINVKIDGIGGKPSSYAFDISQAYASGNRNVYWNLDDASKTLDNLINYAISVGEEIDFDGGVDIFQAEVTDSTNDFIEYNLDSFPPYPQEEDYKTYQENEYGEEVEFFDEDSYKEAIELYEGHEKSVLDESEINQFNSYLLQTWSPIYERYKIDHPEEFQNKELQFASNKQIIKIAKDSKKKILSAHELASYIDALKIYLDNDKIKDKQIINLIKNLPYSSQVKKSFSMEECKILTESIAYAWEKLTGKNIVEESKINNHSARLQGNYWMIKNGILLEGTNHYTIVKQNMNLFSTILGISSLVLHERLASPPEEIIDIALKHGGMRMYINSEGTGFFQLTDETYKKWGRDKIKALDLDRKITRVIDTTSPYKGWQSGILVKL